MEMDVEAVHEVSGTSRFERALAVLIGLGAVLAAVLAAIQVDAGKQEERALLRSSRLAIQVFELTAATGPITTFGSQITSQAIDTNVGGIARALVSFQQPEVADVQNALGKAEERAGARIDALMVPMAGPSPPSGALDPHTRSIVDIAASDVRSIAASFADPAAPIDFRTRIEGTALTDALSTQVDLADRHSDRGTMSLLGLTLLALAGVLVGLAAVLRESPAGWLALATAALAVIGSVALAAMSIG